MVAGRSLGSSASFPMDGSDAPLATGLDNLGISGTVVVVAAGNAGGSASLGPEYGAGL